MKIKYFSFCLTLLLACLSCKSGGNSSPFDVLPDVSAVPELTGNWAISGIITKTSCADFLPVGDTSSQADILIANDGTCTLDMAPFESEGSSCQAAGNQVVIIIAATLKSNDCTLTLSESYSLTLVNDTTLSGTFTANDSLAGDCSDEFGVKALQCSFSGSSDGTQFGDTAEDEPSGATLLKMIPNTNDESDHPVYRGFFNWLKP